MTKNIKIAIYSGVVPSTTFIERLNTGLSGIGFQILLFGNRRIKKSSNKNIHYYTHTNKLSKLFQLIKYSVLLSLFKLKDKKKLDLIIDAFGKNKRLLKVKYYPVLYHSPDIFHIQWTKSIEDWMWVKEFGIKLVVSLRGAHINYSPIANKSLAKMYQRLFPEIDGFHAVRKAIVTEASKYSDIFNKTQVIYSGLNMDKLSFQTKKAFDNTPLRILSIGRNHWKKGYSYALEALSLFNNKGIDFHYTIVGAANDEELLFLRSEMSLEENITFLGELSFEGVLNLMNDVDVLLLPSVEEGIANVVLEAMALGTIIVSTDCGGMNEVLLDAKNGFIVPIRNPFAMAEALQKVAQLTLDDYQNIINEARKTVEQNHDIKMTIAQMEDFYQTILNH